MLQPDVIQQLNLIAYEGWEYHKLSLETWDLAGSGQSDWDTSILADVGFQPHAEGSRPDQTMLDQTAMATVEQ